MRVEGSEFEAQGLVFNYRAAGRRGEACWTDSSCFQEVLEAFGFLVSAFGFCLRAPAFGYQVRGLGVLPPCAVFCVPCTRVSGPGRAGLVPNQAPPESPNMVHALSLEEPGLEPVGGACFETTCTVFRVSGAGRAGLEELAEVREGFGFRVSVLCLRFLHSSSCLGVSGEQIVFSNCLDLCHTPPDSGERQYKFRT